eukprot:CAMPEP_0180769070 /NCGR_PEP_ID=MMETSP1038_2-20121128/40902_1 /TAXON_ID=632150 /ORGANISM="Azadinium spinosum, Strain 3D9" /LENGTH=120 /DNA_ID=CAMNT_0022803763 /DNA_START=195 /DNA_END=553 /DNA_ORIENTATION=+
MQPGTEELTLQIEELRSAGRHEGARAGEVLLDELHNSGALCVEVAIHFQRRQQATGRLRKKGPRLRPVAVHAHLHHSVGDLLLLELHPHLVAIGAPSMVVTVEHHSHLALLGAKEAEFRL